MKRKVSFVTNSSSTSYIITNKTKENKSLVDFVTENPHLIEKFKKMYSWHEDDPEMTQEMLLNSAKENNITFKPGKNNCAFGDEEGTLIGQVFDYILREGGSSKSFSWRFKEYLR
jgi:hypothetical protein